MEIIGDPEALKREILESARRESEAVAASAEAEAAGLLASAEAEAAAARRALLDAARSEGAQRRAMLLASAPAEAAKLRAARLERLLEGVKAEAFALLAAGSAGPAGGALAALAAEAAAGIGGNSFVISSAPGSGFAALAGEIERLAGLGRLDLRFEEDPGVKGGAVVRSADGSRRWDNSFSGRMERFWPQLRREIAAGLGNGGFNER